MPPTYGKVECVSCYVRLPKPQMVRFDNSHFEPGRTRTYFRNSKGGGSREVGRSVGQGRWKEKVAWLCPACAPAYRKKRRIIGVYIPMAIGLAVAIGCVITAGQIWAGLGLGAFVMVVCAMALPSTLL
jgi:hypothetical protein